MAQQSDRFSAQAPPQNLEAEQSVLGACLIDREALAKVQPVLKPMDFYAAKHTDIWQAITQAAKAGPVDLITVQAELDKPASGATGTKLDEIGGLGYLTTLINMVPSTANVEQYAEIVAKKARLRRLQQAARGIVDSCYEADDPTVVMGDMQKALDSEAQSGPRSGLKPVAGRIGAYAEERYRNRGLPNGDWIPSKFPQLREKCPYMRGEVTLVAAPPNTGKTTLGIAEAYFLASLGYQAAFFELEMADFKIYDKLIGQAARLDVRAIRMGALSEPEWFQYRDEARKLDTLLESLSLNTETTETMSNIRWQCLRRKAQQGLDIVIIDFLDRVTENRERDDERYDQLVARIAGIGQAIARECNCHVMILAQIDVKVYHRTDPVPTLADLANSKTNLSSWPDNVITAIQPNRAKGDGRSKPRIWGVEAKSKVWKGTLLLSVAKGRFSEGGALIPVYAEMNTGFLGSMARPWPWHIKCHGDADYHDPKLCPHGADECAWNRVAQWDKEADDDHLADMKLFREKAAAVAIAEADEDLF